MNTLFFRPSQRLEKIAEAHRQRTVLEAQAEAEAIRLKVMSCNFILEVGINFLKGEIIMKYVSYRVKLSHSQLR
jgi:hypothetical protein